MMVKQYVFQKWADGPTSPVRDISVVGNMSLEAVYAEVIVTTTMTFKGAFVPVETGQGPSGPRQVTVTVTKPDNSEDVLPAVNADAQGAFTTTKAYVPGSGYSAKATSPGDAWNKAASSPDFPFTVGLADSSLTLTVT